MARISYPMLVSALVAVTATAHAQSCGTLTVQLASSPVSQGLMVTPAHFQGSITSGNLAPGTWVVNFNDAGWPPNGNARRNYIKSSYTYDAAAHVFTRTFQASESNFKLTTNGGTYVGPSQVTFVASDANRNGQLDTNELGGQTISATLTAICGMGTAHCGGTGPLSGAGSLDAVTSPLAGSLDTSLCITSVEQSTWALVKAIFR